MTSETHAVTNQPPALEDYDAYGADPWLRSAVARAHCAGVENRARALGTFVGSSEGQEHARLANRHPPELKTHDRFGHRIDAVDYHPSYHALMQHAIGAGVHSLAWRQEKSGFSARSVLFYLWNQLEQGTACPVTMTFASLPVFENVPELAREWRPKVLADSYDASPVPIGRKSGATIGMAMTEKQAGSDLREVQTVAEPEGDVFRLTGHKWFCSAPMSDGFFTLARRSEGVSCFFVPRSLPDGERNTFLIQRLKDKCGNRSNASAEIEYRGTLAWPVGEAGRGIPTLIEMAHHTRFDIVVGVAGMMRAGLNQAVHHARHRSAFGKRLVDHALMQNVLADLALETEAALFLAFRLAQAFDGAGADEGEAELRRVLTPIAKYWLCKRMTPLAVEAMECLGGNGYVEDSPLARLYREAPLNGIWEGSANVICLDALRALGRSPAAFAALQREFSIAPDARIGALARRAEGLLAASEGAESHARAIVEALALCMQASLMRRHSDDAAAEAFCASRLQPGDGMHTLGALDARGAAGALLRRAHLDH